MSIHGEHFLSALRLTTVTELEPLAKLLEVPVSATGVVPTGGRALSLPPHQGFAGSEFKGHLWDALSYYGSHNLAYILRGLRGVDYPEIVRDVCSMERVPGGSLPGDTVDAVSANELRLTQKYFDDIWTVMSDAERHELLRAMDLDGGAVKLGGAFLAAAIIAGKLGGFATYKLAAVVAGFFVRALLGTGLRFGAMAATMQALSLILGPIGWIASGAWMAGGMMTPAYRKAVPAVLIVAALRQLAQQREVIGIMGSGGTGKDSLVKFVFGIETGGVHPIPGSTSTVTSYPMPPPSLVTVLNFPGFGDLRDDVEHEIRDQIHNCNLAIYIVKNSDVVQREEIERFQVVRAAARQLIVVFNFCDKLDRDERDLKTNENKKRLGIEDPVLASLKPDGQNPYFETGVRKIQERINSWAEHDQKKASIFSEEFMSRSPAQGSAASDATQSFLGGTN